MKILKSFGCIICLGLIFAGIGGYQMTGERINIYLIFPLCFAIFYLIKPKNKKEIYPLNIPKDTLKDMKKHYKRTDIQNLIRILNDCEKLVTTSSDIDTIISRMELGKQKSYTLKEMEYCGLYRKKPNSEYYLNVFIGQSDNVLCSGIKRSYEKMLIDSNKLKTEKGKQSRKDKFFEIIHQHNELLSDKVLNFIYTL